MREPVGHPLVRLPPRRVCYTRPGSVPLRYMETRCGVLTGEKVLLRALRRDDLQRQWQFNNDVAFELAGGGDPWEPQSLSRLEARFDESLSSGERDGAHFAIEADGLFIGSCGLFDFDHTARTCQLGIGIGDSAYQGRGYGRDALRVLLDYAFRLRNMRKVWLTVNGDNERAIRAYRACGFIEEGRLRDHVWSDGKYIDLVYMGVFRDDAAPTAPA
jgi:RimJ/RimL family protein N-acetyltransferase